MRRFLYLIICFLSPFIIAAIITKVNYRKGDELSRIGKISESSNYRNIFQDELKIKKVFYNLSELNLNIDNKFKFLIIGDSFSQQENIGYQNYLAKIDSSRIVNFDVLSYYNSISDFNPIKFLANAVNGDFFEKLKVDYVILQSVERYYVPRIWDINKDSVININDIKKINRNGNLISKSKLINIPTFIDDTKKFILYGLLYNFDDNAFFSDVYKMKLSKNLFSVDNEEILFYGEDLRLIKFVNKKGIYQLNNMLNAIAKKLEKYNVKLIVLPSPDKYDLYCDYIHNNPYPKNRFFDLLRDENKNYIFIDSKKILMNLLKDRQEDVYYPYGTHWSPIAAKKIAENIISVIQ